jgi:hypothetical protein
VGFGDFGDQKLRRLLEGEKSGFEIEENYWFRKKKAQEVSKVSKSS